jgi:2-dehydropantoate 2-reductase
MGTGGVGGYFGARFAAAGADVAFIARGNHLAAMRRDGLKVESQNGDLHLKPVKATDRPAEIAPVDLAILAVKLWDTDAAIDAMRPLIGPNSAAVSFQNGVEAADKLAAAFGPARVLGGVGHIAAVIGAPGIIKHTGTMARLTIGELDGEESPRLKALAELAKRGGIDLAVSPDIRRAIWEKMIFLATFSGMTALTRRPKGPIFADPDTRAMFERAVAEAVAVARAEGVTLGPDHVEKAMAFGQGLPAEMKSSMLGDLERGNKLELPWLSGAIARMGAAGGVPTPVHQFIYTALKLDAEGGRKP